MRGSGVMAGLSHAKPRSRMKDFGMTGNCLRRAKAHPTSSSKTFGAAFISVYQREVFLLGERVCDYQGAAIHWYYARPVPTIRKTKSRNALVLPGKSWREG